MPEWQKYEPNSYNTTPRTPSDVRVATPADSAGNVINGDVVATWWMLKDPKNPTHSLILLGVEAGWQQPRQIGQRGSFTWALLDEANAADPQLPFLNGIFSFRHGIPVGGTIDNTVIDGKPGIRSKTLNIDYLASSNRWTVQGASPTASLNFVAADPVPGIFATYHPTGKARPTTNTDPVLSSRVTGTAVINGRRYNLDGWRANYWRLNFDDNWNNQVNPLEAWSGWEYNVVFEPDGGASQYLGIISPTGEYTGALVDARPSGTRFCSRTTLKFGDYHYGRSLAGDISPPFQRYTIPGWIRVTCAPGSGAQMTKTFYPDSRDYIDLGLVDGTEMPMHTVPGSMGTYEHWRYTTYRTEKWLAGIGLPISLPLGG